ncbi:MAG: DUF72 domain-containing protein [Candidatus Acidiferrales bacterium]
MAENSPIRVGTSAFTAAGWEGSFYPAGMQPRDFLSYYATKFDTVEVDSTFYRTPAVSTVKGWAQKTPPGFLFALKVPQIITHEKCLDDCGAEFAGFLAAAEHLGDKLGPLLLQFPYFNRTKFKSGAEFLARLSPFLQKLPQEFQFAVEIRNKSWLDQRFTELLCEHKVALAVIDQAWMPSIEEVSKKLDPLTANFSYVRWLGDRKGIEEQTKSWDKTVIDRRSALQNWVEYCYQTTRRGAKVYAYANNHYAGHAPATVALFLELWARKTKS